MWQIGTDTIKNYLHCCESAVLENDIFNRFRRLHGYMSVLEHVGYQHGLEYYNEIIKLIGRERIENDKWEWIKNDSEGGPQKYQYEGIGLICPSTLRYAKVGYELEYYFGNLKDKYICEIGSGYGGQIRLLNGLFGCSQFAMIDLEAPLRLAQKFLMQYDIHPAAYVADQIKTVCVHADIVISNYAVSELDVEEQMIYFRNVLQYAPAGYMIYNKTAGAMEIKSMQSLLKNSIILPEGLSCSRSEILIWGNYNGISDVSQA